MTRRPFFSFSLMSSRPPPLAQAKDTRLEELESECAQLREMIAAKEREQLERPSGVPQPLEPRIGIEHPVMEEISQRLHTQLLLSAGSSERILEIYLVLFVGSPVRAARWQSGYRDS